jgi:hypothetical protein
VVLNLKKGTIMQSFKILEEKRVELRKQSHLLDDCVGNVIAVTPTGRIVVEFDSGRVDAIQPSELKAAS